MDIEMVLGGLYPSESAPLTEVARHDLFHDWHQVHERSGQPFDFDHAICLGFVCNSEPPSRATLAATSLNDRLTFPMMKAVQSAFFGEGRDVTQIDTLIDLAAGLGLDREAFLQAFTATAVRSRTQAQFVKTRQMGVRGLPALVLQQGNELHHICNSWQPLAKIRTTLDGKLDESS